MTRARLTDVRRLRIERYAGVAVLCALTSAIFAWQTIDFNQASEGLGAYRSGLYLQPWRAITSCFIHQSLPHVLFNLVTLWIAGARLACRNGNRWLVLVFFTSLFVGQVCHTLISRGAVLGLSGGVCGIFGFLLLRERQGSLLQTLRSWPFFWWYPLALLLLFGLDAIGLLNIANLNHVVGIVTGSMIALAAGPGWRKIPIVLSVVASIALIVKRPWDPVWLAMHERYAASALLPITGCSRATGPPLAVDGSAPAVQVTLLNPRHQRLVVRYYDPDGALVDTFGFSARARSFLPLKASVWRVDDEGGDCVGQFTATHDGVVVLCQDPPNAGPE